MSASAPGRRAQTAVLLRAALSFAGRQRRRGFWLTGLAFVVVLGVTVYVSAPLLQFFAGAGVVRSARETADRVRPVTLVALLLLAWPATAALVRRGHDRGYPASRTLAVWTVFLGLGLLAPVLPFAARLSLQAALLLYILADYGCTPGRRGPNAYGEDPRTGGARA